MNYDTFYSKLLNFYRYIGDVFRRVFESRGIGELMQDQFGLGKLELSLQPALFANGTPNGYSPHYALRDLRPQIPWEGYYPRIYSKNRRHSNVYSGTNTGLARSIYEARKKNKEPVSITNRNNGRSTVRKINFKRHKTAFQH